MLLLSRGCELLNSLLEIAIWHPRNNYSHISCGLSSGPDLHLKSNKGSPTTVSDVFGRLILLYHCKFKVKCLGSSWRILPRFRTCLDISLYHLYEVDVVVLPVGGLLRPSSRTRTYSDDPTGYDLSIWQIYGFANGGQPVWTDDHHFPINIFLGIPNMNIPWPKKDVDLSSIGNTKAWRVLPPGPELRTFLIAHEGLRLPDGTGEDWEELVAEAMAIYQ